MNKQERYINDPLRHYINPEMIDKSPEGFTDRLMISIKAEPLTHDSSKMLSGRSLVPFISTTVVLALILAAFLIPGSTGDASAIPGADIFNNIKISLPSIDLTDIFNLQLPATVLYVLTGIIILTLLDRFLGLYFHREK
jgi:hypothetical protein